MTASSDAKRSEMLQLVILLAATAVFYFVIIPTGIEDPEGFGLDQGLPPSFSARLVAVLAAILMLYRLAQILLDKASPGSTAVQDGGAVVVGVMPVRGMAGMAMTLLFAFVLVPQLGFYIGGPILLCVLLRVLGETRPVRLVVYPAIVTLLIWGLFGQLLSVRLPVGLLFTD